MAEKFPVLHHGSTIPSLFPLIIEKSLSDVDFSIEDIKSISKLDSNKVYGDDMVSIRMLKLCDKSIYKRPSICNIIFRSCLTHGNFPSEWKKANVVPIYKKSDNQCVKNYRPVSLLPIFFFFLSGFFLLPICNIVLESIIFYRKQPNIRKPIRN